MCRSTNLVVPSDLPALDEPPTTSRERRRCGQKLGEWRVMSEVRRFMARVIEVPRVSCSSPRMHLRAAPCIPRACPRGNSLFRHFQRTKFQTTLRPMPCRIINQTGLFLFLPARCEKGLRGQANTPWMLELKALRPCLNRGTGSQFVCQATI